MLYRKLDASGDRIRGHGSSDFISDSSAVAQAIKTRLLLFLGEWWENTEDGTAFFEYIAGKTATAKNREMAELVIRERITKTRGVASISSFSFEALRNTVYIDCTVNTIYGTQESIEVTY